MYKKNKDFTETIKSVNDKPGTNLSDDEKIDKSAVDILKKYSLAFKELSKNR
jgi:hypothetical protein